MAAAGGIRTGCRPLVFSSTNDYYIVVIASRLDDDGGEGDDTVYYILMRAAEEFYTEYSRYPGWYDDQVEADIPLLKVCRQ